jgi:hypothetical protein
MRGKEWACTGYLIICTMDHHAVVSCEFCIGWDILVHEVSYAKIALDVPYFEPSCGEARVVNIA